MRRVLKWTLIVVAVMAVVLAVSVGLVLRRVYYGKHVYETVPPALPAQVATPAILVFSKTNGFRQHWRQESPPHAVGRLPLARPLTHPLRRSADDRSIWTAQSFPEIRHLSETR